jgi:large subunit ribosomal protein L29
MKKISELRELTNEELGKILTDTQREMFNLRFQRETEQTEKPAEVRKARKLVARIRTIVRERELAPNKATAGSNA